MARVPRTRHLRHRLYRRKRYSRNLDQYLETKSAAIANSGTEYTFTAEGENVTVTAHPFAIGEGPFNVVSTDTLPANMTGATLYWIHSVVDANTVKLTTEKGGPVFSVGDAGVGTHTMHKAESEEGVFEYLRQNAPEVVDATDDADNL